MQVFISYAQSDRNFARKIAEGLNREGLRVWFADEELYPGDNWSLATGKALQDADALVVLLSPAAVKSPQVRSEIDYALGDPKFKGRVIPVAVRPTFEIPWILRRFGVVEMHDDPDAAVPQIAGALRRRQEVVHG